MVTKNIIGGNSTLSCTKGDVLFYLASKGDGSIQVRGTVLFDLTNGLSLKRKHWLKER